MYEPYRSLLPGSFETGFSDERAGQLVRIGEGFEARLPGHRGKVAWGQLLFASQPQACRLGGVLELKCLQVGAEQLLYLGLVQVTKVDFHVEAAQRCFVQITDQVR